METKVLSRYQKLNRKWRLKQKQSVVKPRIQPKYIRQNIRHKHARSQDIAMFQGDIATQENCTIVHLLTQKELDEMKNKGGTVVHVTLPVKTYETKGNPVFWKIVHVASHDDIFAGPCRRNLLIITTYDQLSSSKRIRFIGTASYKPEPKTWALLCLVYQHNDSKSASNQDFYNVTQTKKECGKAKYNIVSGKSTSHHRSHGFIHGFGSHRDM